MGSMNPILAELDGLSPSAKQALLQAHQGASNPMQGTQTPNPAMAALRSPAAPAGPEPPAPTIPPIGGGPSVPAIGTSHQSSAGGTVLPGPQWNGLSKPGNLNIWNRPSVQNADGTHSSEYSTSFGDENGREVLVPTIASGRFLTPDGKKPPEGSPQESEMFKAAQKRYGSTGENLGIFSSPDAADEYANALHNRAATPIQEVSKMAQPLPPSGRISLPESGSSVPAIGASHPNVIAPKGTLAGDQAERSRLMSTGSGESQIYNKVTNSGFGQAHPMVGKILGGLGQGAAMIGDAAASSVLPQLTRAIPGTEMHHQALLHSANTAVANDEANAGKEAQTAQSQAEMPLIQAQTREANATADAKENPQPAPKEEAWEIAKDYTGPNGEPVEVEKNSGQMRIAGQTGPAFKRVQAAEKTGNDFERFYKDYIKDNNIPDSAHNRMMARKEWATASQAPERPEKAPQVPVIGPDGKLVVLHPGDSMPKGSMSPTQLGSRNASEVKETKAEEKTATAAADDYKLMQTLASRPSPTNDLAMVMHYIGATKPESLGKLRLNQNEISLVMGTRSSFGDLEAMAQKVQNGQMLTPKQRSDMLATMQILSSSHGQGGAAQPTEGQTKTNSHGDTIKYTGGKWVIQ